VQPILVALQRQTYRQLSRVKRRKNTLNVIPIINFVQVLDSSRSSSSALSHSEQKAVPGDMEPQVVTLICSAMARGLGGSEAATTE